MGVLMSLATGSEDSMFHICSHSPKRVNRSLMEGQEGSFFATSAATLTLFAHFKRIDRLRKDQAMRQPTLRLQQAGCEQDEKGGSMDHLPPY
jgi:hypothetical protein